jgi:rsbT co-antagonist protein RsbR
MNTFEMDDINPAELLALFQVSKEEIAAVRAFGEVLGPNGINEGPKRFYDWLKDRPEYEDFFADPAVQKRAHGLMELHWERFFQDNHNQEYFEKLVRIGAVHARIGLPLKTYLSALNKTITVYTDEVYPEALEEKDGLDEATLQKALGGIRKLANMESTVVGQTFVDLRNQAIAERTKSLMAMSTPVTQIWEGILMLPLVGIIDSKRAQDIMNAMLDKIAETQARNFILDISGVAVVDTAVANHLIKITKATDLMGCATVISGISPAIAQTIVDLGIEVGKVQTTATMRDALSTAFRRVGQELRPIQPRSSTSRGAHVGR